MTKYLLILLLLAIQLFAFSDNAFIKVKARINNDVITVKLLSNSYMADIEEAKKKNIKPEFIAHIVAIANNKIVYEVSTSGFISKKPFFEFSFKIFSNIKVIKFIITDNQGNTSTVNVNIVNSKKRKFLLKPMQKTNIYRSEIWNFKTPKKIIQQLYPEKIKNNTGIKIEIFNQPQANHAEGICILDGDGSRIKMKITSTIDFSTIAVMQDVNPRSMVALFKPTKSSIIKYNLPIKMRRTGTITVIGKSIDGKIYKTKQKLYFRGGDMDCDGIPNGGGG